MKSVQETIDLILSHASLIPGETVALDGALRENPPIAECLQLARLCEIEFTLVTRAIRGMEA